jgi:hypothetical protein
MVRWLAVAALFVFPGIAQAKYFDTGGDLWNVCTDNAPGHNYLCLGISTAYFDMMMATGYQCVAPASDRAQVRDTLIKYLADNPGMRTMPASELAVTALTTAFQCTKPAPPPPPMAAGKAKAKAAPVSLAPIH